MGSEYLIIDIHPFHLLTCINDIHPGLHSKIFNQFLKHLSNITGHDFVGYFFDVPQIWQEICEENIDEGSLLEASILLGKDLWNEKSSERGLQNKNYIYKVIDSTYDGLFEKPL